jgi:small subunit ribosomal protein S20
MPLIKSAIKKVRKDKKRTKQNESYVIAYKELTKKIKKGGAEGKKLLNKFYALVDKATKRKIIHKKKGSRIKSRITKFVNKNKK